MSDSRKLKTYLAGPEGFSESFIGWRKDVLKPLVSKYVDIEDDPWEVDVGHILSAAPEDRPALWKQLGRRHLRVIRNKELLIANLDGEPPDNGSVGELFWAARGGTPCIGYRNDMRTSGEEGLPYNLMIAAAIEECGGVAVSSLVELEHELSSEQGLVNRLMDAREKPF
jgi:nucleoside 2-deoxyribosyltransferase